MRLSLEEALTLAESTNETLVIAGAGVDRARGGVRLARSLYYPQIGGTAGYTRTFESEFSGFGGGGGGTPAEPPERCGPFTPDTTQSLPVRVDSLESVVGCLTGAGNQFLIDLSDLFGGGGGPFGQGNRYDLGFSLSYPLYTGGSRRAQNRIARSSLRSAEYELTAREAQLTLNVTRAYFDAALSARLVQIAEQTLAQSERTLAVTHAGVLAGEQAEFDELRARVSRDNQRFQLRQRIAELEISYARLRTLTGLPIDLPLDLTTELGDEVPAAITRRAPDLIFPDTAAALRPSVRQAEEEVRVRESQLRIARSERLPALLLGGRYGWIAFPSSAIPAFDDLRRNSSISLTASIPIFTGGRIRGSLEVASADLAESRAQLDLLRDLAAEDAYSTIAQLDAARAEFESMTVTTEEARRASEIAELRYSEGVASLLEVTETRLMLEISLANQAVAARDIQVAQTRLALLPNLPLEGVTGVVSGGVPAGALIPASPTARPGMGPAGGTRRPGGTSFPDNGTQFPPLVPGGGPGPVGPGPVGPGPAPFP